MADQAEDVGLSPSQFPELNRQFFSGQHAPHQFLRHRLQAAFLMAAPNDHVRAAFRDGLQVGALRSVGEFEPHDPEPDERELFIALEAVVLFHHSTETLLRLLLAVTGQNALCPWLEVTRMRQPGVYGKRVRGLRSSLRSEETQDALATWFYGRRDRLAPPDGMALEDFVGLMEGLTLLVAECCDKYTEEGSLYNSAKHGLSAVPGRAALTLGPQGESPFLQTSGPSVTLLEAAKTGEPPRRRWHQSTHWIPPDQRLALTFLVIQQIENLWNVARLRYLDPKGASIKINPIHVDKFTGVVNPPLPADGPGYRFVVPSAQMPLLYEESARDRARADNVSKQNRRRR